MRIERHNLQQAVDRQIVSAEQAEALWTFWGQAQQGVPRFDVTHILYYLGGLLAIGAMSVFMNLGWEQFGGWGIFALCLLYAAVGLGLTRYFAGKKLTIPAGIMATLVVVITPLAVYGLQQGLGVWPDDSVYRDYHRWIQWHWLWMELATLAVAAVMLYCYRYPFLLLPVAVTLWYLSMDVVVWLMGGQYGYDWELRQSVSVVFGLAMIALAFWLDYRTRHRPQDFAFWLYVFGVLTFWGGLSLMESDSELSKFLYCMTNVLMIAIGAVLKRRVFVIFGALGVAGYLAYLSERVFQNSWLFPIALTVLGLAIVFGGVWWQRHEQQIGAFLRGLLPASVQELLEKQV
ncbi:MAG: DUF2157 domain-containing protein [Neisseria sp.]|nr:DUF2157 domain-containing protein [Neisseria sp.]